MKEYHRQIGQILQEVPSEPLPESTNTLGETSAKGKKPRQDKEKKKSSLTKNALAVLSRIVVKVFQEFIHKFLEAYFDDWTIYGLLKDHIKQIKMMLERCWSVRLSLIIKKSIFFTPFGVLLVHIICKDGIMVDMAKIKVIMDLKPPKD